MGFKEYNTVVKNVYMVHAIMLLLMLLFVFIGVSYCLPILFNVVQYFRAYAVTCFQYDMDFSVSYGGDWAIISGASEGLGRSYADCLARRKLNVFLIARREEKLKEVAQEIRNKYNVKAAWLALDLVGENVGEKIIDAIKELKVAVLVNSVGTYKHPCEFLESDIAQNLRMIDVNTKPVVTVTHAVLPYISTRGAIVNVSSISTLLPAPLFTSVHGSTKVFVDKFTRAVAYENSHLTVQLVRPFFISTSLLGNPPVDDFFVADADVFAESALRTLGVMQISCGYWKHEFLAILWSFIPHSLFLFASYYCFIPIYNFVLPKRPEDSKKK